MGAKNEYVKIAPLVEFNVPEAKMTNEKTIKSIIFKMILCFFKLIKENIKNGILYKIEKAVILTFAAKPKKRDDLEKIFEPASTSIKNGK